MREFCFRLLPLVLLCSACRPPPPPRSAAVAPSSASSSSPIPARPGQTAFDVLIHGRVAVVDLWATWCDACKESLPQVQKLADAYSTSGLVVVGVNVGESRELATRFATEARMRYPIYLDPEYRFAAWLGTDRVPTLVVFDPSGRIVYRAATLDSKVLDIIRELLNARAGRNSYTSSNSLQKSTGAKGSS